MIPVPGPFHGLRYHIAAGLFQIPLGTCTQQVFIVCFIKSSKWVWRNSCECCIYGQWMNEGLFSKELLAEIDLITIAAQNVFLQGMDYLQVFLFTEPALNV